MPELQPAKWVDRMEASADFLGNGAIEINKYESEIFDIIARTSVFWQRVNRRPATGHPHRYFEQTAIAQAGFTDPRNITPTPTGPTRVERSAPIKAITNQTNLSLFDVEVTKQQGQFAYLESKDIQDVINSIVLGSAQAIWSGTDTSLTTPTTLQYVSVPTQITTRAQILTGASIVDGLKTQIAQMVANVTYNIRPSAIYMDPILADFLDQEAKASRTIFNLVEVTSGVKVVSIMTQAGQIPIIPDPFLTAIETAATVVAYGFSAVAAGKTGYYAVIVTESDIEMPVISGGDGNTNPRLFQLGLLAGLQGQYVGILFDALIVKGATYAHRLVQIQRP